ncbi:hypothetical protein [Euzebya sp.]
MSTTTRALATIVLVLTVALAFLVAPNVAAGGVLGGSLPWVWYRSAAASG